MAKYVLHSEKCEVYLGSQPQVILRNLKRCWAEYFINPDAYDDAEVTKRQMLLAKEYSSAEELISAFNDGGFDSTIHEIK